MAPFIPASGKKTAVKIAFLLAFLILGAVPAWSQPQQGDAILRWNECAGKGGLEYADFACDADDGISTIVGSFRLDAPLTDVNGLRCTLLLSTTPPCDGPGPCRGYDLQSWWRVDPGGCRDGGLSASTDFSAPPFTVGTGCVNAWYRKYPIGGVQNYTYPVVDSYWGVYNDRVRVNLSFDLLLQSISLVPGTEYYAFRIDIDHAGTIAGACAGCCVPLFVMWDRIVLHTGPISNTGDVVIPHYSYPGFLAWQWGPNTVACGPTPARHTTWGRIKSQYR